MSSKYPGRGTFLDVPYMGRLEVKPGSEHRVTEILKQYQNQSSVKIEYASNYKGNVHHESHEASKLKKTRV